MTGLCNQPCDDGPTLRVLAVEALTNNPHWWGCFFLCSDRLGYICRLKGGAWGDTLVIEVLAKELQVQLVAVVCSGDGVFQAGRGQRVEILCNGNDHYDALARVSCMPTQIAHPILGSHTEDSSHGNPTRKSAEGTLGEIRRFLILNLSACMRRHNLRIGRSGGPLRAANLIHWEIFQLVHKQGLTSICTTNVTSAAKNRDDIVAWPSHVHAIQEASLVGDRLSGWSNAVRQKRFQVFCASDSQHRLMSRVLVLSTCNGPMQVLLLQLWADPGGHPEHRLFSEAFEIADSFRGPPHEFFVVKALSLGWVRFVVLRLRP